MLDGRHLVSGSNCNIVNLQCPILYMERCPNKLWSTINVGDTTLAIYNYYRARQIELITLNTQFSVICHVFTILMDKFT